MICLASLAYIWTRKDWCLPLQDWWYVLEVRSFTVSKYNLYDGRGKQKSSPLPLYREDSKGEVTLNFKPEE
jgi:hypothetical protein